MTEKQIDYVVRYVLNLRLSCEHDNKMDCRRCLGKWIREGIRRESK